MLKSVDYVCKAGTDGIKLQLLHILKDTDLADEHFKGKVNTFTPEEYVDIIKNVLK